MRAIILSTFLVAGAISAPALAAPTCLVEIDGSCQAARDPDGRLVLGSQGGASAVVRPRLGDGDRAREPWQEGPTARIESLGPLDRDGTSCWRNSRARVCAWGTR